jgi:alpha-N-acetylglucosamine transferase
MERCVYDRSKENEEYFDLGERTLPLCFSSFKLLKQNLYNVPYQKSSRYDVEYPKYNGLANKSHLPLCFSSFELLKANHEITEEEGKFDYNGTALHGQIVVSEEDQQPSHVLNNHVAHYMRGYPNSDLHPALN